MWVIINIVWVTFVIYSIFFKLIYDDSYFGSTVIDIIGITFVYSIVVIFGWLLCSEFFISGSQLTGSPKVVSDRQLSKFSDTNQYLMYSKNHKYVFLQDNKVRKIKLSKISFKKGKQAKLIAKKYSYKINQKSVSWYQKYIFYGELDLLLDAHLNTHYYYIVELPK